MTKINWQLLSIQELSTMFKELGSDTLRIRQQKHYYKRTGNEIMYKRILQAQLLADFEGSYN
jgi:hypothetical protein